MKTEKFIHIAIKLNDARWNQVVKKYFLIFFQFSQLKERKKNILFIFYQISN
jgi:hypothetical protein